MTRPIETHEAGLWAIFTRCGVTRYLSAAAQQKLMADVLRESIRFASDAVDREVDRIVTDPAALAARQRLAQATAEHAGRTR